MNKVIKMRHIDTIKKSINMSITFLNPMMSIPIQIGIPKNNVTTNKVATIQLSVLSVFIKLGFIISS